MLQAFCQSYGHECRRGSAENVLRRFFDVAVGEALRPGDIVVRLTGDCQLHDPAIIQACIDLFLSKNCDLAGNQCPIDSFPDGQQVEVFTMRALRQASEEAIQKMELEHVTPFINRQPHLFQIEPFVSDPPRNHIRWTLDAPEDFTLIRNIYDVLYPLNPSFETRDIDALIAKRPELMDLVSHLVTDAGANEGLRRSAQADGLEMIVPSKPVSDTLKAASDTACHCSEFKFMAPRGP